MRTEVLQSEPSLDALEMAEALLREHGDRALIGARAALQFAGQSGDPAAIELLAEVCALLAVREH